LFQGNGYTIEVPTSWHIDTSRERAIKSDMMALANSDLTDPSFNTNINVLITPVPENVSIREYEQVNVQQLKAMIADESDFISSETITKGEDQYFQLDYKLQFGKNILRFHQQCAIANNKAFVFTFTTLNDQWASFSNHAQRIAQSFMVNHSPDSKD